MIRYPGLWLFLAFILAFMTYAVTPLILHPA